MNAPGSRESMRASGKFEVIREVADILHAQGDRFLEQNLSLLGIQRMSGLRTITHVRPHSAAALPIGH
jgi:hypothetical protein